MDESLQGHAPAATTATALPKTSLPCASCSSPTSKYTCPACSVRSCSFQCTKLHKSSARCSGVRSKAAYVSAKEYGYGALMRDYGYLEELARKVKENQKSSPLGDREQAPSSRGQAVGRGWGKGRGRGARARVPQSQMMDPIRKRRDALVWRARDDGVELALLPEGMERRKKNQTVWSLKKKAMYWSLQFLFPTTPTSTRPTESLPRESVPGIFISSTSSSATLLTTLSSCLKAKYPLPRPIPAHLSPPTPTSLVLALPVLPVDSPSPSPGPSCRARRLYKLDVEASWRTALRGAKILEWPQPEVYSPAGWEASLAAGWVVEVPFPGAPHPGASAMVAPQGGFTQPQVEKVDADPHVAQVVEGEGSEAAEEVEWDPESWDPEAAYAALAGYSSSSDSSDVEVGLEDDSDLEDSSGDDGAAVDVVMKSGGAKEAELIVRRANPPSSCA